ncbi:helix-turn-helix transcriptional regulator [Arsukibacterium sp.]|uniref:helix-turn-helix domain-containing protein n=1 Tax=Arsukibacterium sp. TaxID=1977258 RepID=UPI00299D2979|nr:helix-turn-helix transcriptional regulator [Arsukibacterium sp.]MDX1678592.1 helix-turn-helix transcriptional regulator [Arsukibacterium sp.]
MDISAEKLKRFRLLSNLSQELLAKQSGLSLRTIQRLEREGGGSAESLHALCATLNISAEQLQHNADPVQARWQRTTVISRLLLFIIAITALLGLMGQASGSSLYIYLDMMSLIIITSFLTLSTLVCFGFNGLVNAVTGLKYLASSQLYQQQATRDLVKLYSYIYKNCYGAAATGSLIGLVSLFNIYAASANTSQFFAGLHVLTILWLYAAVVAECLLRPLIYKLKNAID